MQIKFVSLFVTDQEAALQFYTNFLGFTKMSDIPLGEDRWLTVASPDGIDGAELVLEPLRFQPASVYQKALFDAGIPATALISLDIEKDYKELKARGVVFRGEPQSAGIIMTALFEDTCGNLINLVQVIPQEQ